MSVHCVVCGAEIPNDAKFCPVCGVHQPVNAAPQQGQPYGAPQYTQPYGGPAYPQQPYPQPGQPWGVPPYQPVAPLTKAQFLRHPRVKSCRSGVLGSAVILYICGAITLLANVVLTSNVFGLLDVALLIGLGLGVQLAQSRACAVVACIYAALNLVITVASTGTFGGWLPLVGAVYGIITTFRFQDAWKLYQRTGMFPASKHGKH